MLADPKHGIGIDHFIIKKQIRQLFQPVAVCRRIENIRDNFNVVIREEIDRLVKNCKDNADRVSNHGRF